MQWVRDVSSCRLAEDAPPAAIPAVVTGDPARSPRAVLTAAPVGESEGETLFENNCSSCHGDDAQGSALAPNLHGVGAATVDLWVSSGWMPLAGRWRRFGGG